ncbi:hypothetical protein [Komagataeibacter sp. FNDCF1]|uniref:hypothetical protein n=1 Tax=Komagataeibacter sp. FNDCF1 TaxID=2878681 RepID=UPI001E289DC6|nr:hypothetical protein [Komagataeibacter sp. FNDCF1]MCE2565103.1 hypothetical protein [Komagataeibacter sp. FNDCF1]
MLTRTRSGAPLAHPWLARMRASHAGLGLNCIAHRLLAYRLHVRALKVAKSESRHGNVDSGPVFQNTGLTEHNKSLRMPPFFKKMAFAEAF